MKISKAVFCRGHTKPYPGSTCPLLVSLFFCVARLLKRELNKQERASDTGMKSAAMGVIPFTINPDLRDQLEAFGVGGGDINWIEMVRLVVKKTNQNKTNKSVQASTRHHFRTAPFGGEGIYHLELVWEIVFRSRLTIETLFFCARLKFLCAAGCVPR